MAALALRLLSAPEPVTRRQVARRAGTSEVTAKRALEWLRDVGADIRYHAADRGWRLHSPFALPYLDPVIEDLQAAMTAAGLLEALGLREAATRAWAAFGELDVKLNHGARGRLRRGALAVFQTSAMLGDPRWVLDLLRAARRQVVRVVYCSPWRGDVVEHVFEPWQVVLHDGVLYVRGYSRTRKGIRTFNLAHVRRLWAVPGLATAPVQQLGAGDDLRLGIDEDRPGVAALRFRGGAARWVAGLRWHPAQRDEWDEADVVLRRTIPYRSCRELARRLATVADGLVEVEPPALADELEQLLLAGLAFRRMRG